MCGPQTMDLVSA